MARVLTQIASILIGLSFLTAPHTSIAADISLMGGEAGKTPLIFLIGEIESGDFEKLFSLGSDANVIYLNSEGGDVDESIRIGRYLRAFKFRAIVHEQAVCASACVLAFVGAVERLADDKTKHIGLHRPYYERSFFSGLSADEAQNALDEAIDKVEAYLVEMEVPASFIEEMMMTKSTSAKVLTGYELVYEYGVGMKSPSYEEWIIARCGDLTDQEWSDLMDREPRDVSLGYRDWLKDRADAIGSCMTSSRNEEHENKIQVSYSIIRKCLDAEGGRAAEADQICWNKALNHKY